MGRMVRRKVPSNDDCSVGQLVTSPVHPDYEDAILRATKEGIFTEADIDLNDIEVAHAFEIP